MSFSHEKPTVVIPFQLVRIELHLDNRL